MTQGIILIRRRNKEQMEENGKRPEQIIVDYVEEKMKEVHLKSFADGFYGCLNAVIRQFNEGRTKKEILNWCKSVRDNRQIIIPEKQD